MSDQRTEEAVSGLTPGGSCREPRLEELPWPKGLGATREHLRINHGLRGRAWYPRTINTHEERHAGRPWTPDHRHPHFGERRG